jgi:lipopolysaccharide/colanic/teichoic acid biosynthesis glycosyltransferase
MSLVGPRPHLPEEVAQYSESDYLRLECMPGIVGLPQIRGPNTMNFKKSVELDLWYRRSWSFPKDLAILSKTLKMFINGFFQKV